MTMKVETPRAYLHGALMTPKAFNYIRSRQNVSHEAVPYYDAAGDSIEHNIELVYREIIGEFKDRPFDIVSHSMGGLMAIYFLQEKYQLNIRKIVGLSVPYAGVAGSYWMKYILPRCHLFKDISTGSQVVLDIKNIEVTIPLLNIVTTWGSDFFGVKKNDGVVSVESQLSIEGPNITTKEFHVNHMEVLLDPEVATLIREFLESD